MTRDFVTTLLQVVDEAASRMMRDSRRAGGRPAGTRQVVAQGDPRAPD